MSDDSMRNMLYKGAFYQEKEDKKLLNRDSTVSSDKTKHIIPKMS